MSTSQRVNRGFHRLGLLLAALVWTAHFMFAAWKFSGLSWSDFWAASPLDQILAFYVEPTAVALVVALAVYGVVRAIGWVIGGFTMS